jgi:serine/threonine-protein kinase
MCWYQWRMETTAKGYRIELDVARRIAFLKVWGLWSNDDGRAFASYFQTTLAPWKDTAWDVVADISEFPPQRGEVNGMVAETMRIAATTGMRRAANVVSSAMTKLQIQRLSEESGLPAFAFFKNVDDAVRWLRT